MAASFTDFIPHGMVTAFAGVVTFVFRQHTKQDDDRYALLNAALQTIASRQTEISDKMAENHAELLKTMLEGEREKQA